MKADTQRSDGEERNEKGEGGLFKGFKGGGGRWVSGRNEGMIPGVGMEGRDIYMEADGMEGQRE